jgi:hypothetical protein
VALPFTSSSDQLAHAMDVEIRAADPTGAAALSARLGARQLVTPFATCDRGEKP